MGVFDVGEQLKAKEALLIAIEELSGMREAADNPPYLANIGLMQDVCDLKILMCPAQIFALLEDAEMEMETIFTSFLGNRRQSNPAKQRTSIEI